MSSKSEHIPSIRWPCWVVYWVIGKWRLFLLFPSAHAVQGETLLKTAQQVLVPSNFGLSAIPGKDKAVCPWDSSTSPLALSWREVKGVLFPEAWQHISVHLASTAVSSHKGLLKAESIFCHSFPLFMAFSSPFWAPNVPASMGCTVGKSVKAIPVWVLTKARLFPEYCAWEGDYRLERVTEYVRVYTPRLLPPPCTCLNFLP